MATTLENMSQQARDYALNQHPDLIDAQQKELTDIKKTLKQILEKTRSCFVT
jgi:hypothetical protein